MEKEHTELNKENKEQTAVIEVLVSQGWDEDYAKAYCAAVAKRRLEKNKISVYQRV